MAVGAQVLLFEFALDVALQVEELLGFLVAGARIRRYENVVRVGLLLRVLRRHAYRHLAHVADEFVLRSDLLLLTLMEITGINLILSKISSTCRRIYQSFLCLFLDHVV